MVRSVVVGIEHELAEAEEALKDVSDSAERFFWIYANASPDGRGLGLSEDAMHVMLFTLWLKVNNERHGTQAEQSTRH